MKTFNITALIYNKNDATKQTIFMNEIIVALCESDATTVFHKQLEPEYEIVKIFSVEKYCKVAC